MSRLEYAGYAVDWLAKKLSEARILVNGDMCPKCRMYGAEACAKCWAEAAWGAAYREMKRREEWEGEE